MNVANSSDSGPPIAELLERSSVLIDSIKSGVITFDSEKGRYPSQAQIDAELTLKQEEFAGRIRDRENMTELNPEVRSMNLEATGRARDATLESIQRKEQVVHKRSTVTFDASTKSYRRDDKPTDLSIDANSAPYKTSDELSSVNVMKNGDVINYFPDVRSAVVTHQKGATPLDHPIYLGILDPQMIRTLPSEVSISKVDLEGSEVLVYTLSENGRSDALTIFIDPKIGYRYRRIDFMRDGRLTRRIDAKDYKMFGDTPFPTEWSDTSYRLDGDPAIEKKEVLTITDASFNQDIDPSVFEISFAPGTKINDIQLGIQFNPTSDFGDLLPGQANPMALDKILDSSSSAKNSVTRDEQNGDKQTALQSTPISAASLPQSSNSRYLYAVVVVALVLIAATGLLVRRASRRRIP